MTTPRIHRSESTERSIGTSWDAETTGRLRIHFPARTWRREVVVRLDTAEAEQLHRSLTRRLAEGSPQ